jgi:hypothetical protein
MDSGTDSFLRAWDDFVERRSLPYFRSDHRLMMRQLIERYPPGKLSDLTDRDLLREVNREDEERESQSMRSFRYFLTHFNRFLEEQDLAR